MSLSVWEFLFIDLLCFYDLLFWCVAVVVLAVGLLVFCGVCGIVFCGLGVLC